MKKITLILIALLFSPLSFAEYAKGTIDEIKICSHSDRWIRTLQFKVAGKWFGTLADYSYGIGSTDHDNNQTTSLIMMAYSLNNVIEVNFNYSSDERFTQCGTPIGKMFYNVTSDYIKLSR